MLAPIHAWNPFLHRLPDIDEATDVVFDLDPGTGASIVECCEVALLLRKALQAIKLESFAKVSGSKGLQVYVPLHSGASHATTGMFSRMVAGINAGESINDGPLSTE